MKLTVFSNQNHEWKGKLTNTNDKEFCHNMILFSLKIVSFMKQENVYLGWKSHIPFHDGGTLESETKNMNEYNKLKQCIIRSLFVGKTKELSEMCLGNKTLNKNINWDKFSAFII